VGDEMNKKLLYILKYALVLPIFWPFLSHSNNEFNYKEFISEISKDSLLLNSFNEHLKSKNRFLESNNDLDESEYNSLSREEMMERSFLSSLVATQIGLNFDWAGDPDRLFEWIASVEKKKNISNSILAKLKSMIQYADSLRNERGDYIGRLYGPISDHLEENNLILLNVNNGSDSYNFLIMDIDKSKAYIGKKLSSKCIIEHPGWQFANQLIGTKYEKYLIQSRLMGSDPNF
jgi:hypothetical protein